MVETRHIRSGRENIIEYDPPVPDDQPNVARGQNRFGGAHSGIWNVTFCDGSARPLNYDIDAQVAAFLSDRRDEQPVDASKL